LVVSAPAGFGKTSLALGYAGTSGDPACWFTPGPADQDGARFLSQLALAMQRVFPELDLSALPDVPRGTAFSPDHAAFIEELALRFADLAPERCLIIIDGFCHVQDSPAV